MALQFGTTTRNAILDAIETAAGTAPILTIRSGAAPANCAASNSGTVLATLTLPSDWMAAASGGTKAKSGTWEDASADAAGTAAHFRIHDSTATTCHAQGTITSTLVGTGDLLIDNVVLAAGQDVLISSFTLTAPGA
jgi:hypothetical protein